MKSPDIHNMTPKERAVNEIYLSHADFAALAAIAAALSREYPDDWYARHTFGKGIFVTVLAACMLAIADVPWWIIAAPFAAYLAIVHFLSWRYKRAPGLPRWAHPSAIVATGDAEIVAGVLDRLKPVQRSQVKTLLPCSNGEQFWWIWRHAQDWRHGHA